MELSFVSLLGWQAVLEAAFLIGWFGLHFWLPISLFLFGLPHKSPYPLITNGRRLVLP
jgi:hypothetical protein